MPTYIDGTMNAPQAVGPYSRAVSSGNLVFLSGQIALDPQSGKLVDGGIEAQTAQVLKNISGVLEYISLTPASIIKTTIFLTDLSHFKIVNEQYGKWVGENKPARSTIQVAALPLGAIVEIEVIAEKAA